MSGAAAAALVLTLGAAAPVVTMALLAPQLARVAPRVENYRGRSVYLGLGAVWAVWAAGLMLAIALLGACGGLPAWAGAASDLSPLVLGSCALGAIDDLAGPRERAKGFRGHARALAQGRMTLGGLKMLGIGALAVAAALRLSGAEAAGLPLAAGVALRALVIALGANALNLLDVRPARALKGYLVCLLACGACLLACHALPSGDAGAFALVGAVLAAPALAVWRFDARAQGMLGDAGSNAMGACMGYVMAWTLPAGALAVAGLALLALNVAAERMSLSALVERVGALRWLDGLGRSREE